MSFAMIFPEKPRSLQGDNGKRQRYKARIAAIASGSYTGGLLTGELYARIIWFYSGRIQGDIDNIIKPILDALTTIVYRDDDLIVKCSSEKVDKNNAVLSSSNISPGLYNDLLTAIADPNIANFCYVEVSQVGTRQVVFGPVI